RPPAGADVRGGATGGRPRLAHTDRHRPRPPRPGYGGPGQPRPDARARRRRRRAAGCAGRAGRQRRSSRPRVQPRARRAPDHRPRRAGGDRRPRPRRDGAATPMTVGVVAMAYGTPRAPYDIEAYYTDIRRGRPPTPEQLADLIARYEAIGGT